MKRLKDNIMLIILSVVIIICSICICNKIENARYDIKVQLDALNQNIPSYSLVKEIHGDIQQIKDYIDQF